MERANGIPNTAGGEGGRGTAKPDAVIHRYIFNSVEKQFDLRWDAKQFRA